MIGGQKPLWKEGLFLTPQHFQSMDHYHERLSWYYSRSGSRFNWGITAAEIDRESIANWQFGLKSVMATMRDGTPVECPDYDILPPGRNFKEFLTPDRQTLIVYLGFPRQDVGRANVLMSPADGLERTRFGRTVKEVRDFVSGSRPREIEFVSKNVEIRFEGEDLEFYDLIPLAELMLAGAGVPTLNPDFLPPSLALQASPRWLAIINAVFGKVNALTTQLRQRLSYSAARHVTLGGADLPVFFQAQALATAIPVLKHLYHHPHTHPIALYQALTDLTSRLWLVLGGGNDNLADENPVYDHEAPTMCIQKLVETLELRLSWIETAPRSDLSLNTVPGVENRWECDLANVNLIGNEEFYLWASADVEDDEFQTRFISEFRTAAPDKLDNLIAYGLPGVRLAKVTNPPVMLPAAQNGFYFRVDRSDALWQEVATSGKVVMTGDFPNLKIRLHVLRT